uniref:Uncharacterized protein n=1 Tax=Physcomitrium patens TaxID=3218 RepID=A0A2K1IHI0_PHYPA|nr:hypothetical protein PHYPA_029324 [Physcomitrium patens]
MFKRVGVLERANGRSFKNILLVFITFYSAVEEEVCTFVSMGSRRSCRQGNCSTIVKCQHF